MANKRVYYPVYYVTGSLSGTIASLEDHWENKFIPLDEANCDYSCFLMLSASDRAIICPSGSVPGDVTDTYEIWAPNTGSFPVWSGE